MDRRAGLLVLLVLTLPLVGCLGAARDADPVPTVAARPVVGDAEQDGGPVSSPAWDVGDAWSVVSTGNGTPRSSTLVVTQADAAGYVVSTDDESLAAFDALHDVSYVGLIRASDLAGSQHEAPVQFFAFPLTDGKTWTTTWDGREIRLTARWVPAMETSAGIHPGFTIEGTDGDKPYVAYDYVPSLRWWSHLAFANGYGFRVERVHSGWSGQLVTAQTQVLLEGLGETPAGSPNVHPFTVDDGQSFVSLTLTGKASLYARGLVVLRPDGKVQPTTAPTFQATSQEAFIDERLPPTPGEWKLVSPLFHHPDGAFRLLVREVKVAQVAFP